MRPTACLNEGAGCQFFHRRVNGEFRIGPSFTFRSLIRDLNWFVLEYSLVPASNLLVFLQLSVHSLNVFFSLQILVLV